MFRIMQNLYAYLHDYFAESPYLYPNMHDIIMHPTSHEVTHSDVEILREARNLLRDIKMLKKEIFGESKDLPTYCFACGEYIGTFVLATDTIASLRVRPLCESCFKAKVGKIVMPKNTRY